MRIIAGKYKFKKLNEFNVPSTRPTSDKVKEAEFDMIRYFDDKVCLDLFAGTGALGIEALSRGAKKCYFVEENIDIYRVLVKNFREVNVEKELINALRCDFLKALKGYKSKDIKFDIIFIDPPYATNLAERAIYFILNNNLLASDGIICWEHDKTKLNETGKFNVLKQKRYGNTYLTILNNYA